MSLTSPCSGQPRAASASIGPLASWSTLARAGSPSQRHDRGVVLGRDLAWRRPRPPGRRRPPGRPRGPRRCRRPSRRGRSRRCGSRGRRAASSQPATSPAPRSTPSSSKPESSTIVASWTSHDSRSRSRSTRNSRESNSVCTRSRSHDWASRSAGASSRSRSRTRALRRRLRMTSPRCSRRRLALLAGDQVGVGDHAVEPVVLVDPPRREPRADAGHAGQVVGGPRRRGRPARGSAAGVRRTWPRPPRASSAPARRPRASGRAPSSRSVTSWRESRSPVRISTSMPSARASVTSVAMMSSAS